MAKSSTTWQKGQSGNASGRRKEVGPVRKLAKQYTEAAIDTLAKVMEDECPAQRPRGSSGGITSSGLGQAAAGDRNVGRAGEPGRSETRLSGHLVTGGSKFKWRAGEQRSRR
jgi:hypothetical protein